ncbi:bifunctional 23S rRNA (guanine(2069)-N(7))-methyltransferase RlmK/23S rRNA (guanine(2445)-N(2))-methyltransferase RlmL [Thiohalomonas denitrificans]|uniref:bifunctional 23S rRNA (guanine(2069)-N(7))-methyltransferase RlmK/23S rRNA (guanine(2445)-N(2))-methyltransferase RlmL n=1 Tax=Thiohalomonas denitrificans TaxID=415747 RepID=UPI0026EDDA28|nr:bifunctional 23S rRNA (guanine(2069)-N(7))-methyltransferase RlmK/23S rRNA (guanine(2445)-N(2))-methyltransferase RlmL [Thiohalomonas denitrificans]
MKFFATAPRGLTTALADELTSLGLEPIRPTGAGVHFQGPLEAAYRACLWSRLASRVLLPITDLEAPSGDALYEGVKGIRWERHLNSHGTLAVDCSASRAAITHSQYAALRVKDAIVDRFREQFGERPSVDTETPDVRINLHLRGDRARLSVDLSGTALHRRGYRSFGAAAPLKENLAAGILHLAGWPQVAASGGSLFDPLCGSGTLLIEGALMAADIAPGLYREHFGFLGWKRHAPETWEALLKEAQERRRQGLGSLPAIIGFDRSKEALAAAAANTEAAGLKDRIRLERHSLSSSTLPSGVPAGLLVTNPPYGERLGDEETLKPLYALLGELLQQHLPDWHGAVFTGNPRLARHVGLKPKGSVTLYNGPIECRLLTYPSVREHGTRMATGEVAVPLANRLRKNLKHLTRWARREGVDCYRIYDQDLPEYAVAIDLYQGEKQWVHVQEYQAPHSVPPETAAERLDEALATIADVLALPSKQIFVKVRQRQKGYEQYEKLAATGRFYEVREWNCRFLVNFTDYLDTGLFLDHRLTRRLIQQESAGKRLLNLFCYTGTATVHAALGGAVATTSVDLSRTYLEWAERNLRLNGLDVKQHELIAADCRDWLADAARAGERDYDLIFMDPPTFSTSKRMEGTLDIQRDHVALIRDAIRLLCPGGELVFSNNFRKFRLDTDALADLDMEDITRSTIPEDFRRRPDIHRCWRIRPGGEEP